MAPSHYLKQCWNIVNLTLRNKIQWNINRKSYLSIQGNALENVICQMSAILSQPQCVKLWSMLDQQLMSTPLCSHLQMINRCNWNQNYGHLVDTSNVDIVFVAIVQWCLSCLWPSVEYTQLTSWFFFIFLPAWKHIYQTLFFKVFAANLAVLKTFKSKMGAALQKMLQIHFLPLISFVFVSKFT